MEKWEIIEAIEELSLYLGKPVEGLTQMGEQQLLETLNTLREEASK